MTRMLRIGTRGSQLALVQANWVAARLGEHGVATEIEIIRTEGDDRATDTAWGEGAFVGRIVAALLDGRVDLAVHSAKDVPTDEHPDLVIAAYPPREDPRDALCCRERGQTLATLPQGARIGTDSPRRTAFLLAARPDLQLHPLHGNVDTRLAKLDRGDSDALVLAVAGLTRLGRADRIDDILPLETVIPAPGQGSLALQVRAGDAEAIEAVGLLDHLPTRWAVEAERALLNGTGGGCRAPIGIHARMDGEDLLVTAGAGRSWSTASVARVQGRTTPEGRRALAARLAERVVALRARPRVLVARPDGRASELVAALDHVGLDAVHVPAIEIHPAGEGSALDDVLANADPGAVIVLPSANAARAVLDALARNDEEPLMFRWAAVGPSTAMVLLEAGLSDVFVPWVATAASLAAELHLDRRDMVILPHADIAEPELASALRARGVKVVEAIAYETHEAPDTSRQLLAEALDNGPVDVLVLTSGSTCRGLLALAPDAAARAVLAATPVIVPGATTAAAAREAGFGTVIEAVGPDSAILALAAATAVGLTPFPGDPA